MPTGVVTFLLTDIEGSTRRWETEPHAMREALARHDLIVNTCVRRLNGYVVKSKGEGDSVFAVFNHARDAVAAALVLQVALGSERWPTSVPIRVRMAIHTGQVELRDGDYFGPTVNRCARLRALAQGGQVLLSGVSAQLAGTQLPSGASLTDLGSHQLKDLSAPERVWLLTHPRLVLAEQGQRRSEAAPTNPKAGCRTAYVLTDHLNRDHAGREWGLRIRHADGQIRCYTTMNAAALLNPIEAGFRLPRLWEATVDRDLDAGEAFVDCQDVTTLRQVATPAVTGLHQARFAVLCARAANEGGKYEREFKAWAAGWLEGEDSSGTTARELADALEREARPDPASGLTLGHVLMLANAARAAGHASKLSWLVGRARDTENAQALELAADAIHTALRMAKLDLASLTEMAMPRQTLAAVGAGRRIAPRTPERILRALPT